jgi:hypothetical protein
MAASAYAIVYRQRAEVASPPSDWKVSLTEFTFASEADYDCEITRGNGYVSEKTASYVRCCWNSVTTDAINEVRLTIRKGLKLWDEY